MRWVAVQVGKTSLIIVTVAGIVGIIPSIGRDVFHWLLPENTMDYKLHQMQKNKHRRKRLTGKSVSNEQTRLLIERSQQLLLDTDKVLAESKLLHKKLRKILGDSN